MVLPRSRASLPKTRLHKELNILEVWGFGLSGLLLWLGPAPAMNADLGSQAVVVWAIAAIGGMLLNLQVQHLGLRFPEMSGGTPNYTAELLKQRPLLAIYGAIGYFLGWVSVPSMNGIILTELVAANLDAVNLACPEVLLQILFTSLPFIVALSGTRALGLLHLCFILPAIGFLLLLCLQGLSWLAIAPDSPGLIPETWSNFSIVGWSKWYFLAVYAAYGCETASSFIADNRNYRTTLKSLSVAALLLPIVYVGGSWLLMRLATDPTLGSNAYLNLVAVASPFWGKSATLIVTFLIASGCLLSSATAVANTPRILYQLARDHYLAPVFAIVSRRGSFGPGLIFTLFLSVACLVWVHVERVVMITGTSYLCGMIAIHLGLWLQRGQPGIYQPRWALAFGLLETAVLVVGGIAWSWQDLLIGLLLPLGVYALNLVIARLPLPIFSPRWWFKLYRDRPFNHFGLNSFGINSFGQFVTVQILVLLFLVCGGTLLGWKLHEALQVSINSELYREIATNLLVLLLLVVGFVGVAIACWTSLPQVAAIADAREQSELLFAIAQDGIIVIDEFTEIRQANPAAVSMFSRSLSFLARQTTATNSPIAESSPWQISRPFSPDLTPDFKGISWLNRRSPRFQSSENRPQTNNLAGNLTSNLDENQATNSITNPITNAIVGSSLKQFLPGLPDRVSQWQTRTEEVMMVRTWQDDRWLEQNIVLEIVISQLNEDNDDQSDYLAIVRDITEQKAAELTLRDQAQALELRVRERTAELEAAKEKADAANQAKSTFIASMSHELRTPLNAILGFAQIMTRSQTLTAEHQENVGIIARSGEHLLTLINNILDLSKIEAGKTSLNPQNFDLHQLLNDVHDLLQFKSQEKGLELLIEYDPETLPRYVQTDPVKLRQVLINLIGNGIKFTDAGGVSVRASINPTWFSLTSGLIHSPIATNVATDVTTNLVSQSDALTTQVTEFNTEFNQANLDQLHLNSEQFDPDNLSPDSLNLDSLNPKHFVDTIEPVNAPNIIKLANTADRVDQALAIAANTQANSDPNFDPNQTTSLPLTLHFEVEDSGMGIAPEEQQTLFEAFTQTASGRQAQEGTGLGLPISRRFVNLMGGDITVRSQLGEGCIFQFTIQVIEVPATSVEILKNQRRILALAPGSPQYRLLIVDDKPLNRQLLVKLLAPFGFSLKEAENGQEAIEIWQTWKPDLIWMDIQMPILNGYEATRRIRQLCNLLPGEKPSKIVAVTASMFEEERAIVLQAGCDDFLRKPFREESIFEMLVKHLNVEFIYEDLNAETATCETIVLHTADLLKLPQSVRDGLQNAIITSDLTQIAQEIEAVRQHDPAIATALKHYLDQFEYEIILDLLTGEA